LNRQNATVAARLRQKERKMEKICARCAHVPALMAHAVRMAFWRFKKTFFRLKYCRNGFFYPASKQTPAST
jgi:hypothetical protein